MRFSIYYASIPLAGWAAGRFSLQDMGRRNNLDLELAPDFGINGK